MDKRNGVIGLAVTACGLEANPLGRVQRSFIEPVS